MTFIEHYTSGSFKDTLDAWERAVLHKYHEAGHHWVGLRREGTLESVTLNPDGESMVLLKGLGAIENHYDVGVAGMLGEAMGWLRDTSKAEVSFNFDKFDALGNALFEKIKDWQPDPKSKEFIEPTIPMIPYRERGQLSVADMTEPLTEGLSHDMLVESLHRVGKEMNENWDEFLQFIKENEEHYGT